MMRMTYFLTMVDVGDGERFNERKLAQVRQFAPAVCRMLPRVQRKGGKSADMARGGARMPFLSAIQPFLSVLSRSDCGRVGKTHEKPHHSRARRLGNRSDCYSPTRESRQPFSDFISRKN